MNECRAIAALVDLLQVDNKFRGIMFGVRHYLGAEEGNNVVGNDLAGFILEVGVVNTEVGVEPIDFASNEFTRNETLNIESANKSAISNVPLIPNIGGKLSDLGRDFLLDQCTLFLLTVEDGGGISREILDEL